MANGSGRAKVPGSINEHPFGAVVVWCVVPWRPPVGPCVLIFSLSLRASLASVGLSSVCLSVCLCLTDCLSGRFSTVITCAGKGRFSARPSPKESGAVRPAPTAMPVDNPMLSLLHQFCMIWCGSEEERYELSLSLKVSLRFVF